MPTIKLTLRELDKITLYLTPIPGMLRTCSSCSHHKDNDYGIYLWEAKLSGNTLAAQDFLAVASEASLGSSVAGWVRRVLSMGTSKGPVFWSPVLTQEMTKTLGERPERGSTSKGYFRDNSKKVHSLVLKAVTSLENRHRKGVMDRRRLQSLAYIDILVFKKTPLRALMSNLGQVDSGRAS